MSSNLERICTVDISLASPISNDASFDNILILGPAPKAPKEEIPAVGVYNSLEELTGLGFSAIGDAADPVGVAARVAFSQSPKPHEVYVACMEGTAEESGEEAQSVSDVLTNALGTMLMYGKEASNRKPEIDRQHHTIPNQRNQRPKDKHRGNVYNLLFRHGKVRSQNMEKLKCSFPTFCKQTFPQLHKTASYAHYAQCRLLRNPPTIFHIFL